MVTCYVPKRYIFAALAHLGVIVCYAMRVNLSVTIVSMVNQTYANENKMAVRECSDGNQTVEISNHEDGKFRWNQNQQGLLLSSFFYGYLLTHIPGGWIANKYGGKWVFAIGMLLTVVLTAITPVATELNYYLFLVIRVVEGIGEGVVFPAILAMVSQWSPIEERARISVIALSGTYSGTLLTYPLAGLLADSAFLNGWPSVFYMTAIAGLIWFVLWTYFIYNTPEDHPTISSHEKKLIAASVKETTGISKHLVVPWKEILTSLPVWAMFVAHACKNWVWYMVLTGLPSYFKNVLNFNLKANGFLSALPFLVGIIVNYMAGFLTDWLQNKKCSNKTTKRLLTFFGFYPSAILLILASYASCDQIYLSVTCMVLATAFLSFNQSGYLINELDIAPRYSGTIMGVKNFIGTIPGCIAPSITGYLTNDDPSRENYRKVFIIAACICTFGGTFFIAFLSGAEQAWNRSNYNEEKRKAKDVEETELYVNYKMGETISSTHL